MKKTIILILFIFITNSLLKGETVTEMFSAGNELYKQNKYSEALKIYNRIKEKREDWKVYNNIGNCYYRLMDFVKAKIFYLRAKKLNKLEVDIDNNIKVVNRMFKDKNPERKVEFFSNTISKIESYISLNLLTILLVIFILAFNTFLFLLLKNRGNGKNKYFLYLLVVLFIFSTFTAFYLSYRVDQKNKRVLGVVLKDNTALRSGKDNRSKSEIINAGLDLKIIEDDEDWVRVRITDEVEGWVKKTDIEII